MEVVVEVKTEDKKQFPAKHIATEVPGIRLVSFFLDLTEIVEEEMFFICKYWMMIPEVSPEAYRTDPLVKTLPNVSEICMLCENALFAEIQNNDRMIAYKSLLIGK
jgi:hypothetical protein